MEPVDQKQFLETQIKDTLRGIYDPEIPVNIYDLGLVYEVKIDDDFTVNIKMTLTSPNCPVAESLPVEVHERIKMIDNVKEVKVEIVFYPPWDKDMMTDAAKLDLGFL
ncbi:MAG: iron-sulfur cluster assembly protein [Bacteroidetes bacterium]|nr:iron-sulfur cluster assembly protein [Bacteroidota bacterium]